MSGEAVTKRMNPHTLAQPRGFLGVPASLLNRARGDRSIRRIAREEELGRASRSPVLAEDREQAWREHDVAVLLSLGLADADDHPPAVDVVDAQGHDLGD